MKKFFYISIVLLISLICLSSCNDAGGLFNGARNASKLSNDIILGILDVSGTAGSETITFNSNLNGVQTVSGSTDTDYSEKDTEDVYSRKVRGSNWFNDVAYVNSTYYAKIYDRAGSSNDRSKITTFDKDTKMLAAPTSDTKYSCLTENGYALTTDNKCYLITNTNKAITFQDSTSGEAVAITNLLSSTGNLLEEKDYIKGYFLGSDGSNYYVVKHFGAGEDNYGIVKKCSYKENEEDEDEVSINAKCLAVLYSDNKQSFILDSDGYIYKYSVDGSGIIKKEYKKSILDSDIPSTAKFTGMFVTKNTGEYFFWISTKKNGIYKVTFTGEGEEQVVTATRVY